MPHAISALSNIGDTITYVAGRVTITLQWVREGAYSVTVYQGTYRIDENCGSYSTEALARSVARLYAELYRAEADATEPASLAVLAQQGTPRQIRPTMAGAHLADSTGPQHRALRTAADSGRVERGGKPDQEPRAVLAALGRKGFLRLVMKPGTRHTIAYGVITPSGSRGLARLDAEADRRERITSTVARHAA